MINCTFIAANYKKDFKPCQGRLSIIDLTLKPFIILKVGKNEKEKKFFFHRSEVNIADLNEWNGKTVKVSPQGIEEII